MGYSGRAVALPSLVGRNPGGLGAAVEGMRLDGLDFTGNQFAGLAVAIYGIARLGTLRICDNSVRDSYSGFFFLDAGRIARTNLAGSFEVPGADAAAVTAIGNELWALLHDPVTLVLTAFAGTYPRPAPPGEAGQTRLDPGEMPRLRAAADEQRQAWTARLVERIAAEHPAPEGPSAGTPPRVVFEPDRPSVDRGLRAAVDALRELVRLIPADAEDSEPIPAVQFSRNDIECQLPDGSATGPALALNGPRESTPTATAVVSENRMVGPNGSSTAGIAGFGMVTVTGNVCIAADSDATSPLTVADVPRAAITGNVLFRFPRLPTGRPFPPPLDTWAPLNTIG
jgi:hypothetical protein